MIAVDFDNTIADSMTALWEQHQAWDPYNAVTEPFRPVWDFDLYLPREVREPLWAHFNSEAFTRTVPPIAGANAGLRSLVEQGASLMLVSDRPRAQLTWLIDWLDVNDFPQMMVVTTGFDNGVTKQDVAERYGTLVAIDDAPHHIENYAKRNVQVLIPAYPYNLHVHHLGVPLGPWTNLEADRARRIAVVAHTGINAADYIYRRHGK